MGSCRLMLLLASLRCGEMAPMTGELQQRDTSSFGRTVWEDEERESPFM